MLNKCMIIGNLGADPEMRYTPNGDAVTEFRVASNRSYTARRGDRVVLRRHLAQAGGDVRAVPDQRPAGVRRRPPADAVVGLQRRRLLTQQQALQDGACGE